MLTAVLFVGNKSGQTLKICMRIECFKDQTEIYSYLLLLRSVFASIMLCF
jgi:hypothetical protein